MESEGLRSKMEGEGLRVIDGWWGLENKEMEGEGWDRRWRVRASLRDGGWCAMGDKGLKIFLVYYLYKT